MTAAAGTTSRAAGIARRAGEIARRSEARLAANLWLCGLLLWLCVVPAGRHHILIPLLAVSSAAGAFIMCGSSGEAIRIRTVVLLFATAGALPVLLGAAWGNSGWVDVAIPLVGGPIAWFAISHLGSEWFARTMPSIIAIGTIVTTVLVAMLILNLGRGVAQALEPTAWGIRSNGTTRANFVGVNSLLATMPMLAVLCWERWRNDVSLPHEHLLAVGLAVGTLGVLLSGRQAAIGVAVLTPLFLLGSAALGLGRNRHDRAPRRLPWKAMAGGIVAIAAAAWLIGIRPIEIGEDFAGAAGATGTTESQRIIQSAVTRSRQAASLLDGFRERPIFGWGAGAVSPEWWTWRGYTFELDQPMVGDRRLWRAELSYHLLLFEGGVAAAAGYLAATVVAIRTLRKRYLDFRPTHRAVVRAATAGSMAIVVASVVDPYTRSVGQLWPLFLPVILVAAPYARSVNQSDIEPVIADRSQSS